MACRVGSSCDAAVSERREWKRAGGKRRRTQWAQTDTERGPASESLPFN